MSAVIDDYAALFADLFADEFEEADRHQFARLVVMIDAARPSWHSTAPCAAQPYLFFTPGQRARSLAFTLCGGCPHRMPCLDYAIDAEDFEPTIYGGLDGAARRRVTRARAAAVDEEAS